MSTSLLYTLELTHSSLVSICCSAAPGCLACIKVLTQPITIVVHVRFNSRFVWESRENEFLIPVFIEKRKFSVKKKVYEYTVKYSGENIVKNLSLEEKLKTDFGLQLPELEDEDKPEDYLKKVEEAIISKQRDWKIRRYGALSLLNFSQLLMYLDLKVLPRLLG